MASYVGKGATGNFADIATTITVSKSGVVVGNLLVTAFASSNGDTNNPSSAVPTPPGWTLLATSGTSPAGTAQYKPTIAAFWKIAAATTESATCSGFFSGSYIMGSPIAEFAPTGSGGSWAVDGTPASTSTATLLTSGSAGPTSTPAGTDNVVFACCRPEDTVGNTAALSSPATTGFTSLDLWNNNSTHSASEFSYKLNASTAQSAGWTWTTGSMFVAVIGVLKYTGAGGTAYNLTAAPASYAVTPAGVLVPVGRSMVSVPSSYSVTAAAVTPLLGRGVSAAAASYSVTPAPASSTGVYGLSAAPAGYAVTAAALQILVARALAADPTSYAVSTPDGQLLVARGLTAAAAAYAVAAAPIGTTAAYSMSASPVNYGVTPQGAGGPAAYNLGAAAASYAVNPAAVLLTVLTAGGVSVDPAAYGIVPFPVQLLVQRSLAASAASYAVTPSNEGAAVARGLPVTPAAYAVTPAQAGTTAAYGLPVSAGSYSVTVTPAGASVQRMLSAAPASYGVAPGSVTTGGVPHPFSVDQAAYGVTVMSVSFDLKAIVWGIGERVLTLPFEDRFIDVTPDNRMLDLPFEDRYIPPI